MGQACFPVRSGRNFPGGMPCESQSWIETHDPNALLRSSSCDTLAHNEQSLRTLLPAGQACSALTDPLQCCSYLDNRSETTNVHHGQPCVPLRNDDDFVGGDRGVCEPASLVAELSPRRALECTDVRTNKNL